MSGAAMFGYFFAAISVLAALYIAVSRDILRMSVAFFVEEAALGGVLLTLGADYLALFMFMSGVLGAAIIVTFSSVTMGELKTSIVSGGGRPENERAGVIPRVLGMLLGLGIGGALAWVFLTAPFGGGAVAAGGDQSREATDVAFLGKLLLGEHAAVFEILAVMILLVVVGAGLLLRRPDDAN
jgi:NADH:ubiquinone oxidoreductase subunit 6 (subunit J)